MKSYKGLSIIRLAALPLACTFLLANATHVQGAQTTWINAGGGSWADPNNWQNGFVGDGIGTAAGFNTLTLAGETVVSLDGARTVGSFVFGDAGNTYNWVLDPGNGGSLTLDAGPGVPVVEVLNQTITVHAVIAGNQGLTKTGSGTLRLTAANSYMGGTMVNGGTLELMNGAVTRPTEAMTINKDGVLNVGRVNTWGNSGITAGPAVTVNAGGTMANTEGYAFTLINPVLAGGVLRANQPFNPVWGSFGIKGTLRATGSQASTIKGEDAAAFVNISENTSGQSGAATFEVADVTGDGTADLTVAVPLANMGVENGLIKTGLGTLELNGQNTYSGSTVVSNGTLMGTGTISGAMIVANGGTLAPGATTSVGVLTVSGPLATAAGGTNRFRIDKRGGSIQTDQLSGMAGVTYGGTLTVVNVTSDATKLALGDKFVLFTLSSGSYAGAFEHLNLPPLVAGLFWDTSGLYVDGSISVTDKSSVPVLSSGGFVQGGHFQLTFSGTQGQSYTVLTTTNMALPRKDWTQLTSGTFGVNPVTFIDTGATNSHQFYQITSP